MKAARQHIYCLLLSTAVSAALAQFTVKPEPSYTVNEGQPRTVHCSAEVSHPPVWQVNSTIINSLMSDFIISQDAQSLTIPSANRLVHTAAYKCSITLSNSTTIEANFNVTVHYIDTESGISIARIHQDCAPNSLTAYYNESLSLQCFPPTGLPMVNVTWYLEGNKLRAKDDPTIDFSNNRRNMIVYPVSLIHAGNYYCEAANTVNENSPLRSQNLSIHVTEPNLHDTSVSILSDSRPLLVGRGRYTNIQCKIVPPVDVNNVRWSHNGQPITPGGDYKIVQRSHHAFTCLTTLHIDNVTTDKEGTYKCEDSGSGESSEIQLILASLVGPLVVDTNSKVVEDGSTLVGIGEQLRLVCQLDKSASQDDNNIPTEDFVYSWTHNGSAQLSSHVEVKEGRELVVTASLSDSGSYQCEVSSPPNIMTPISAHIDIKVEARPTVTIRLSLSESTEGRVWEEGNTVIAELGADVILLCSVSSPRNSIFTWHSMGQVVGSQQLILATPSSSRLALSHITEDDLTNYHCSINDSVHLLRTEALQLVEADYLYVKDGAAGVKVVRFENGSALTLVCEVRGGPGDKVRWFVGENKDTELTNQIGGKVEIVTNGNNSVLTKHEVTAVDAGKYICIVEGMRMESRRTFEVRVTVPGRIESTSDPDIVAKTGDRVQFDCVTSGIPQPNVSWLFNSQPIDDDSVKDLQNGSLVIDSVSHSHSGIYYCYLLGTSEGSKFNLQVEDASEGGLQCGNNFSDDDCTTLLIGGSVAILFLVLALCVFIFCVCILCCRWREGLYTVPLEHEALEMKRPYSSRSSNGAATGFSNANNYMSSNSYGKELYPMSLAATEFGGTILSEIQRSVTPPAPSPVLQTPGTGCTGSMFSTDDQSSLTATLPNFPRRQLELGEELGEGEFGPVVLGVARNIVSHEDITQVVVKVLVRNGDGDDPDLALVDFANQMKIEYEHIACILGLCTDTEPYYVLYEYLDQGDMKKYLIANRPVPGQVPSITPHALSRLVLQVADGMAFLFSQRIIHGDLATRNCLISSHHLVKIADLGIGHDLYQTDYYDNGSQLLPIRWMPPELLVHTEEGPAFSLHSDIWSFGVLCWEVFTFGQLPFEGLADEEVLEQVPEGHMLAPPTEGCPPHLQTVMSQCWHRDPEARPLFSTLCMEINIMGEE